MKIPEGQGEGVGCGDPTVRDRSPSCLRRALGPQASAPGLPEPEGWHVLVAGCIRVLSGCPATDLSVFASGWVRTIPLASQ